MDRYQTIIAEVRQRDGVYVCTCWVASVLAKHGLPTRPAHNRQGPQANPCPAHREPLTQAAMRRLGMLHHAPPARRP